MVVTVAKQTKDHAGVVAIDIKLTDLQKLLIQFESEKWISFYF